MHRTALVLCVLSLPAGPAAPALAQDLIPPPHTLIRTGRYSALVALPTAAQTDPFQELVTVRFPPEAVTVGLALEHLLTGTGYRLLPTDTAETTGSRLTWLFDQPLPRVHRSLGPLTLADALGVLGGPAFRPVVDHLHRLVTFEPTMAYRIMAGEG